MQVCKRESVCRCHTCDCKHCHTRNYWLDKTRNKSDNGRIETVDTKLFEELGGKKTADKKEKLHTLKLKQKKKKLFEVVEEAITISDKAEKLKSSSIKQKIDQLNQI